MKPMYERHRMTVSAVAILGCVGTSAAAGDKAEVYKPQHSAQSTPLRVEVLDGIRFRDIETHTVYRLYGVATCVPGQVATLGRQTWPCGTMATAWLVTATLDRWVSCNTLRQVDGERLARCASADHADIGGDMVREGVALTLPPTDDEPAIRAYVAAERDARKVYRGLWASSFQMPWLHRDAHPVDSPVVSRDR